MRERTSNPPPPAKAKSTGARFESDELENDSFFWPEEVFDNPAFHDGWSAIRRRPVAHPDHHAA